MKMYSEQMLRHTRAHANETAESQGFALRSAYKDGIDIWLPADTF